MKTKKELQEHCQQYINSINLSQCNIWEKRFVNSCKEEDYQFNYYQNVFYKGYDEEKLPFRTIKNLFLQVQTSLTFFQRTILSF